MMAPMARRPGKRQGRVLRAVRLVLAAGLIWAVASAVGSASIRAVPSDAIDQLLPDATSHKLSTAYSGAAAAPDGDRLERAAAAVGPLFPHGISGGHTCTASVVTSTSGDVIVTAAHCISGTAANWLFVPGFAEGETPYGVWTVTGAYVERGWASGQDTDEDIAVLRVAPRQIDGREFTVQDVAGSNPMGTMAEPDTVITDVAYNANSDTRHICAAPVYVHAGVPAFDCDGFVGGSSGSPWLAPDANGVLTVRGLIGGVHQGGCSASTSFSSPIDAEAVALVRRADAGGPGDTVAAAGGSGC